MVDVFNGEAVDGRNLAPVDLKNLSDVPILQPSQVVQDFFDQPCLDHSSPNLQPANLANEKNDDNTQRKVDSSWSQR